ncbi:hypothetical protein B0T10DRAFT_412704 [Thelonectria olida]|uniref:TM2 domain-containing protein n=1 Tax=Thelonectria olida TaxID=1576542 RepID=A0A9P9AH75_9HYPO|nr:hypothetical protein B0T10DRAFT_417996 [Thelonectria olida]KAH6879757.1 hypothetical protein B0T10DRAFT_412704 [Thelonectria olida]
MESSGSGLAHPIRTSVGDSMAKGLLLMKNHWVIVLLTYMTVLLMGFASMLASDHDESRNLQARFWGGFAERPMTDKCYQQERTAMFLSLFLGLLGVDQFYARHWPLAVFKFLTIGGLGLWSLIDTILWIVGGVYGTPGCPGGSAKGWQY